MIIFAFLPPGLQFNLVMKVGKLLVDFYLILQAERDFLPKKSRRMCYILENLYFDMIKQLYNYYY